MGYHGTFRSEALHVLGLFFQKRVGYEQREIGVYVPGFLKPQIEMSLDIFPQGIPRRTHDHTSPDRSIIRKFRRLDNILIPLGIILFFGCYVSSHKNPPIQNCKKLVLSDFAKTTLGNSGKKTLWPLIREYEKIPGRDLLFQNQR